MKRSIVGAAFVAALVLVTVAGAAPTVVASPGPSPFSPTGIQPCGNQDQAAEQIAAGSTLYPDSEIEPRSARYGSTIVGEYQQDRWDDGGARGLVASVSHDNGASWHRVVVPGITACSGGEYLRASDPWVSFGPTGDLYAISLSFFGNPDPNHNAILVSKSTDLGEHWSAPTVLTEDTTNGLDKESITADPGNSNYVYAAWDRIVGPGGSTHASDQGLFNARSYKSQTFVARSTNGGASWEAPQQIFVDSSFSGSIGSIIRVGSGTNLLDGLVTYGNAPWKGGACASVSVLRSPDKGATWAKKPVIVSPLSCTYGGAHNPDTRCTHPERRPRRLRDERLECVHGVGGRDRERAEPRSHLLLAVDRRRRDLVDADRDQPHPGDPGCRCVHPDHRRQLGGHAGSQLLRLPEQRARRDRFHGHVAHAVLGRLRERQ